MTKEEIAQWVIDNRYPKSENLKTSDFEIYHFLTAQIGIIESENERLKAERDNILNEVKDEIVEKFDSDPMVRRISNMVINEIKKRIPTP